MPLSALRIRDAAGCKSWCATIVEVNESDKTVNVRHNAARIAAEVQLDASKVAGDNDADKATAALGAWMAGHHRGERLKLEIDHRAIGS